MDTTEIEARLAAAPESRSWKVQSEWDDYLVCYTDGTPGYFSIAEKICQGRDGVEALAEFIAHAPEDIRALLDEVKRLQAQIDAVKALHCQDAVQPRYCAECSDFGTDQFPAGELIEWPCPTLLAFHGDES